jgi:hypothetical protein
METTDRKAAGGRQRVLRARALTLVEMLVAFISTGVLIAAVGSVLMQTLAGYRNAAMISAGHIGSAMTDARMRILLTTGNVMQDPAGVPPRKVFASTPSVGSGGTILKPRAFAYVRTRNDFSASNPPRTFTTSAERRTGVVYWYRRQPYAGQTTFDENTTFMESVLYWLEMPESAMTGMGMPARFFTQFSDAQVLALGNDVAIRKASVVLGRNLASFTLDDSVPSSIQYRVEFLVAQ